MDELVIGTSARIPVIVEISRKAAENSGVSQMLGILGDHPTFLVFDNVDW